MSGVEKARNNSSSVRRALSILIHFGGDAARGGASLTEVANALEMNKSTLLRLMAPLIDTSLVTQDPETGRYRLGWRTAQLGQAFIMHLDLPSIAHQSLERLAADSGETTHLVIPEFPNVIYVDKVDGPRRVRMVSRVGTTQPAYCTAVGKALLAYAAEETIRAVVDHGMPARTARTHTTARALMADLRLIRERGYAVDDIENEPDIRCVAAPVFDHRGTAICAISVSGPAHRVTAVRATEVGAIVAATARQISRSLGNR